MMKDLKRFFKIFINMTRIPLKPIRMQMNLTIISYQHFVQFMITKGIRKPSKKKKRLHSKFLNKRNEKTKKEYQDYKKLFESIKKRSKKLYFSKLILKYKNNIKKTWQVIKEAIGKEKYKQQNLPKKILVDKKSITETVSIAEIFDKYFTQVGPKLAEDIVTSTKF